MSRINALIAKANKISNNQNDNEKIFDHLWEMVMSIGKTDLEQLQADHPEIDGMTSFEFDDEFYDSPLAEFQSKLFTYLLHQVMRFKDRI